MLVDLLHGYSICVALSCPFEYNVSRIERIPEKKKKKKTIQSDAGQAIPRNVKFELKLGITKNVGESPCLDVI